MNTLAEQAIEQVSKSAETIRNDEPQCFPEAATPGDCWRQGDVYITLLGEVPTGAKRVTEPDRQIVPGTSQGSRHILDSLGGATLYRIESDSPLIGPVLECEQQRTITHPEHGDVILPPGIYGITYQRDLDAEDRERRVID